MTRSNSCRQPPNANSRSASWPRAASTVSPAVRARSPAAANSADLPIPATPSTSITAPRPRDASSSTSSISVSSRSRSISCADAPVAAGAVVDIDPCYGLTWVAVGESVAAVVPRGRRRGSGGFAGFECAHGEDAEERSMRHVAALRATRRGRGRSSSAVVVGSHGATLGPTRRGALRGATVGFSRANFPAPAAFLFVKGKGRPAAGRRRGRRRDGAVPGPLGIP